MGPQNISPSSNASLIRNIPNPLENIMEFGFFSGSPQWFNLDCLGTKNTRSLIPYTSLLRELSRLGGTHFLIMV